MEVYYNERAKPKGMIREKKIAIVVMLLYFAVIPGAAFCAFKFLGHTSLKYEPPKGTVVYQGTETAIKYFPKVLPTNPMFMVVSSLNSSQSIVDNPLFKEFSEYLDSQIKNKSSAIFGVINDALGYFLVPNITAAQEPFLGGDHNQSSIFQLGVVPDIKTNTASLTLDGMLSAWCDDNGATFQRNYTSIDLLAEDAKGGIVGDLMRVDLFSFPLAFAVLALCVGSIRLLIVSAASFTATVTIAFGILYPISFAIEVSAFAPELSLGVMAAISVDYSLFVLTRFREQVAQQEILLGPSPETQWIVVMNTAVMSGHNIILSGVTIAVAVGSIAFLPVPFLSTIGLTTSICSLIAVFVSLTIQPAMLLVFYNFLSRSLTLKEIRDKLQSCFGRCCSCCRSSDDGVRSRRSSENTLYSFYDKSDLWQDDDSDSEDVKFSGGLQGEFEAKEYKKQYASPWFKIGLLSVRHPYLSILAVLALGTPFFYFASKIRVDFDLYSQVPENSPHGDTLKRIIGVDGGSADPFYVTFAVRGTYDYNYWKTEEMTNVMRSVIEAIVERTDQEYDTILSPNMILLNGTVHWLAGMDSILLRKVSSSYDYLFNRTVSLPDMKSAYIALTPPVNPFGSSADKYLNTIQEILNEHAAVNVFFDYGLLGASSASWITMHQAINFFPYQLIAVFLAVLVFVLVVFRSVALPVRMLITIAYTVFFAYGVGVIVFQYTWLRPVWKNLDHVESYCFIVPIFAFMLLTALALDYDVFLITRIIEFKEMGYTTEAAIVKAVWKTGSIISMAGIVMLLTIGALTLSSTMLLAQFGVICGSAIIVDTFIIRPFFAPALMSALPDKWFWWPRRFPELNRGLSDMRMTTKNSMETSTY